jgi:molybdenum cofactor cytidylyltransferase
MITAIVLAAGLSRRMGQPKMLLEWGAKTVIEQVVGTLRESGIKDVIVVAGALYDEISNRLKDQKIHVVFNPSYANGEMIDSLQTGLSHVLVKSTDVMVVLGDQPFLNKQTLGSLINASDKTGKQIVMPSIQNKRGHPWIIKEPIWNEIRNIKKPATLRDFIRQHEPEIEYVLVEDDGIIRDMDTPEEYKRLKPKWEGE